MLPLMLSTARHCLLLIILMVFHNCCRLKQHSTRQRPMPTMQLMRRKLRLTACCRASRVQTTNAIRASSTRAERKFRCLGLLRGSRVCLWVTISRYQCGRMCRCAQKTVLQVEYGAATLALGIAKVAADDIVFGGAALAVSAAQAGLDAGELAIHAVSSPAALHISGVSFCTM